MIIQLEKWWIKLEANKNSLRALTMTCPQCVCSCGNTGSLALLSSFSNMKKLIQKRHSEHYSETSHKQNPWLNRTLKLSEFSGKCHPFPLIPNNSGNTSHSSAKFLSSTKHSDDKANSPQSAEFSSENNFCWSNVSQHSRSPPLAAPICLPSSPIMRTRG